MTQPAHARTVPATHRGPAPSALRVIPGNLRAANHTPFALLAVAVLLAGFVLLLVLNTVIAQSSFGLHALQDRSSQLSAQEAQLTQDLSSRRAASQLAKTASAMGMVRPNQVAYIDLTTGAVSGVASPATQQQAVTVVESPNKPAKMPDLTGLLKVTPPVPATPPAPTTPAATAPKPAAPTPTVSR